VLEGDALGHGQRDPGREDALDDGVVRGVEQEQQLAGRRALVEDRDFVFKKIYKLLEIVECV
jgi:hypothetical protein